MVVQQKTGDFLAVFGLCWKVLEKNGVAVRHFACRNSRPATGVGKLSASVSRAAYPFLVCGGRTFSAASDGCVLGQAMIFFNLLLIAFLVWRCAAKAGVIKSRTPCDWSPLRAVDYPDCVDGADRHGLFLHTLRLSGRWIETVYLVIIWNRCTRQYCVA